jgi:hypothetical protein
MEQLAEVAPYDQDFALWVLSQVAALRSGNLSAIDVENLTEELEALAKRDRRALKNRIRVLGVHLLKGRYQPEKESGSWRGSIMEQSERIQGILEDSPSLLREVPDMIALAHKPAISIAMEETGVSPEVFSANHPDAEFLREWCMAIAPGRPEVFREVARQYGFSPDR